jgi:23S rRNA (cytosine1962-C5)-methyltransferase
MILSPFTNAVKLVVHAKGKWEQSLKKYNPSIVDILNKIDAALHHRHDFFKEPFNTAFRLFNGFTEGFPVLTIDVYAKTLLLFNFADPPETIQLPINTVCNHLLQMLPWIQAAIVKSRHANDINARHGQLLFGQPDRKVLEDGTWYAINLLSGRDAGLYLDTRILRDWIQKNARGLRVLNTFAYTGSLGVAAAVGGADQVIHMDQAQSALEIAKESYRLNNIPILEANFLKGDFFKLTGQMRRAQDLFNLVIIDPPFFSVSSSGRVDLNSEYSRLINKVHPLVSNGGRLVVVNNALFVSGESFLKQLSDLCKDSYLSLSELIPVPEDFTGYTNQDTQVFPTNPAPFNHPTKIAILEVKKA